MEQSVAQALAVGYRESLRKIMSDLNTAAVRACPDLQKSYNARALWLLSYKSTVGVAFPLLAAFAAAMKTTEG